MKKKMYEILRKYVARIATGKLGKVEITEDEIICYVDGKKLKKKEKYIHRYNFIFKLINPKEELYKTYRVVKPVHYIVENVDFDMEINIRASMKDCHVTFENCTFTAAIEIDFADHLTFINNTYRAQNYKNYRSIYKEGEFCISTYDRINEVNKLEFINDKIYVPNITGISITESKLQLWLYAKEVILNHSDIIDAKSIEIGADTLYIENEYLISKEIEIKANKILFDDATIRADVITIDSPSIEGKLPIYHEGLFINGVEVDKNEAIIDNYDLELQQKRLELINTLKKMEGNAEEAISQQIKKQPLTKVLKK